jgi:hypothetical protein
LFSAINAIAVKLYDYKPMKILLHKKGIKLKDLLQRRRRGAVVFYHINQGGFTMRGFGKHGQQD